MQAFTLARPQTLAQALAALAGPGVQPLAGGQSLLAAMKLGLAEPQALVDLGAVPALRGLQVLGDQCTLGAMTSHAQIAANAQLRDFCPMLGELAGGIGDAQIRNRGTIGGSVVNNDPAACWPAGVLALNATLHTNLRTVSADQWFNGFFSTTLQPGELLLRLSFARPLQACYLKWEQAASRFALVGVALVRFGSGVRVAITGLGQGVARWPEAEARLDRQWSIQALTGLAWPPERAQSDIHASAEYRAHLVGVLLQRALARLTGEPLQRVVATKFVASAAHPPSEKPVFPDLQLSGQRVLPATPERLWQALLDPAVLQRCIKGCESFVAQGEHQYQAVVRVGLGPLSARFQATIGLRDLQAPRACTLHIRAAAGALGQGEVQAQIAVHPQGAQSSSLDWRASVASSGRIAQLGQRLLQASARGLIDDVFARLQAELASPGERTAKPGWLMRLRRWLRNLMARP